MSTVRVTKTSQVKYFNCKRCNAPLMDTISQAAGWCGCMPVQGVDFVVTREPSQEGFAAISAMLADVVDWCFSTEGILAAAESNARNNAVKVG